MQEVRGKLALVTGASQGIGKGIAQALVKAGCRVALLASGEKKLMETVEEFKQGGGKAEGFVCDLSNTAQFLEVFQQIEATLGPVEILVNNVGVGTFKPMRLTSFKEAMGPIQLPFGIAVAACHAVIPGMIERGSGHIVNLTSPAGFFPLPNMMPYTASRHAMVGLSLSLYEELAPHGVGVSLICPSQVNTGYFTRNDADMNWYPRVSKIFPVLEPEEVGAKVLEAILNNRKQVIFPPMLHGFVRMYQLWPDLFFGLLKVTGLMKPSRK